MKTFTVRQLDREPAAVLNAADREGVVQVKRRDGRVYSIQRESLPRGIVLPDFAARRRKIFGASGPVLTKAQTRLFDKLIAGE